MKYSAEPKPKMHPSDSETFCLKWNDFIDNVITSFAQLRKDKDFADVTLAPGDGGQTVVRAHRVVLASGSHVLKSLLTQHPSENPLIFMRGMKQDQLNSIVDFLYFGEVSIHQDELNDFLALAEELQLKGLTESKNKETSMPQEIKRWSISGAPNIANNQQILREKKPRKPGTIFTESGHGSSQISVVEDYASDKFGKSGVSFRDGNDDLETEISKYLEKVQGTSNRWSCLSCGKIDQKINIKKHIEGHHLDQRDHICNVCGTKSRSRNSLQNHMSSCHRRV